MITTRDEAITALACWYAASVANIKKSAATPEARLWAADYYAVQLARFTAAEPQLSPEDGTFLEARHRIASAENTLHALISRLTAPSPGQEEGE